MTIPWLSVATPARDGSGGQGRRLQGGALDARIEANRPAQVVLPITSDVAAIGSHVGIKQNVSNNGDNYNQIHIEEQLS